MAISVAQDNVYRITGTGTAATDDAIFNELVTKINAAGEPATIEIDGEVFVTTTKSFTQPVSLRGVPGRTARINSTYDSGGSVIRWNANFNPSSETSYAASTEQDLSQRINSAAYSFSDGDWFIAYSEDALTDVPPHLGTNGLQCPESIHQVYEWDGTGNDAYVSRPIVDQLNSNAGAVVVPITPMKNIVVEDLEFEYSGAGAMSTSTNITDIRNAVDILFRNCRILKNGPGAWSFNYVANLMIHNCIIEGQGAPDQTAIYGLAFGAVNDVNISNCTFSGCRHVFTTSGRGIDTDGAVTVDTVNDTFDDVAHGLVNGNVVTVNASVLPTSSPQVAINTPYYVVNKNDDDFQISTTPGGSAITFSTAGTSVSWYRELRWGTPQNVLISDCVINDPKDFGGSTRIAFDTHAEGWGITMQGCRVNVLGGNLGAQSRARNMTWRNCHFQGDTVPATGVPQGRAIDVYGPDCKIIDCTFDSFDECIKIVKTADPSTAFADDCRITGNKFYLIRDPAIQSNDGVGDGGGSNIHITYNTFYDCGQTGSTACIDIDGGTGHKILHNTFRKNNNTYSIDINSLAVSDCVVEGNVATGYGAATVGFTGTASATFERDYHKLNTTDGPAPVEIYDGTNTTPYATLSAAISAAAAGDIIYLDPGTVHTGTELSLGVAEVRITTRGGKAHVQRATSTTNANYLLLLNSSANNCVIENIIFDGIATGTNSSNGELVRVDGDNNRIVNCEFYDAYTTGTVTNSNALLFRIGDGNVADGCIFKDNISGGIKSQSDRNRVQNCEFYANDLHVWHSGSGESFMLKDCQFEDSASKEGRLLIDGGSSPYDLEMAVVEGCNIHMPNFEPAATSGALYFDAVGEVHVSSTKIYHTGSGTNVEPSIRVLRCDKAYISHCVLSGDIIFSPVSDTFTTDFATANDTLNATSHPFSDGDEVHLYNSASDLPNGLDDESIYYVTSSAADSFKLSKEADGAPLETFTDDGTGTNTCYHLPYILSIKDSIVGRDVSTTNPIYLADTVQRLVIEHSVIDNTASGGVTIRTLEIPDGADWNFISSQFYNRTAGTNYLISNSLVHTGVVTWFASNLVNTSSGSYDYISAAESRHLFKTRGMSKNMYEDSATNPSTTTIKWKQGDLWFQLDASASSTAAWQVTAAGTSPAWKTFATLGA